MPSKSLPGAWVERLFSRFVALYGSAKVAAMWADANVAEVKAVWSEELGRFDADTLRSAMQAIVDSGREWPPTLPEFVAACHQARRPPSSRSVAALPGAGGAYTDVETARRNVARIRQMLATAVKRVPEGAKP